VFTFDEHNLGEMDKQRKMKMTPETKERIKRMKADARKVVASRSSVQFRIDEETMSRLMKAADEKLMPVGTMVRMWIAERLDKDGY
jgi:hypothetical protein